MSARVVSILAAVAILAATTLEVSSASPAHATASQDTVTAVDAGEVVVVDPADQSKLLTAGGSATPYLLQLPEDATCPGDTFNDQWRVQSFIVPVADDPGTLTFLGNKPDGDHRWALYETDGETYVQIATAQNTSPGQPATIPQTPPLSLAVFDAEYLPPGAYRFGIACTLFQDAGPFWDTEIEIVADPADAPGQFTWSLPRPADTSLFDDSEGSARRWVLAASCVVLAASLLILLRLRSSRTQSLLRKSST